MNRGTKLNMSWNVTITASAKKQLKKLSKSDFDRIAGLIDRFKMDPFNFSDLKKLSGKTTTWRLRSGSYRIMFELFPKEKAIFVFEVVRRTSVTY